MLRYAALGLMIVGAGFSAAPLVAAPLSVFTEVGPMADANFRARCGGADTFNCEFVVGEGRAGNRQSNGNGEVAIFDRIGVPNRVVNGQGAGNTDYGAANPFTLSYDGFDELSFSYLGQTLTLGGYDFSAPATGADNPTRAAQTLVVRTRNTDLSNLMLNSMIVGTGGIETIPGGTGYLYVSGVDLGAAFSLTGDALLGEGNNANAAFQFKVTDLDPIAPIPLPPAAALLMGGLAALGLVRRRVGRA